MQSGFALKIGVSLVTILLGAPGAGRAVRTKRRIRKRSETGTSAKE